MIGSCTTVWLTILPEIEQIYLDYVEGNYAAYGLNKEYASGFIEMMSHDYLPGQGY